MLEGGYDLDAIRDSSEVVLDQFCRKKRKCSLAHVNHGGRFRVGERAPIEICRQLAACIGTGHELDPARGVPAGKRNTGLRCRNACGGDARNDLVADARHAQHFDFFFEPTKNASIA